MMNMKLLAVVTSPSIYKHITLLRYNLLDPKAVSLESKKNIYIYMPEAKRIHKKQWVNTYCLIYSSLNRLWYQCIVFPFVEYFTLLYQTNNYFKSNYIFIILVIIILIKWHLTYFYHNCSKSGVFWHHIYEENKLEPNMFQPQKREETSKEALFLHFHCNVFEVDNFPL